MSKIKVSVVTEMEFESERDLNQYLKSDGQAKITGFAREIWEAWKSKQPLHVETPRPDIGAVTKSFIEVKSENDIGAMKRKRQIIETTDGKTITLDTHDYGESK